MIIFFFMCVNLVDPGPDMKNYNYFTQSQFLRRRIKFTPRKAGKSPYELQKKWKIYKKKYCKNRKTLRREHLIGCQGVQMFLIKYPFNVVFLHKLRFVKSWVLSQFEFLSFVTIWVFELSLFDFKFECLSFITIWVLELYHNLSIQVIWWNWWFFLVKI